MVQFKSLIQSEYGYTDFQMKQIRYILSSLGSEISKLIFLMIYFSSISKLPEMVIAVITLLSVRNFTGGIHLKHYTSCFILSFGVFYLGICILPTLINLNTLVMLIILNICIVLTYLIGPVFSVYRASLSEEHKKNCCIKAATSILLYMFAVFVFQKNDLLYTGFWMIVLQTLQLGLAKIYFSVCCIFRKTEMKRLKCIVGRMREQSQNDWNRRNC